MHGVRKVEVRTRHGWMRGRAGLGGIVHTFATAPKFSSVSSASMGTDFRKAAEVCCLDLSVL